MGIVLVFATMLLAAFDASAQGTPLSGLSVRVTRNGVPAANATVCVGTTRDLNSFYQSVTDGQGRAQFQSVPGGAFVVTANGAAAGAQWTHAPATPASNLPFMSVTIALPASGGPSCPATPAGPQRRLVPRGVTVPRAPAADFTRLRNNQRCFGAIGMQCGQAQGGLPLSALCAGGMCFVNPGSWQHDECCFRNPRGMACQAGPLDAVTGHDGNCVASWDMAVRLTSKGLNWSRSVDFDRTNSTGTVEFALYCAPANALLPPGDAAMCCSRQTRALNVAEAAAALAANEQLAACR
jgi:hypothetical protein